MNAFHCTRMAVFVLIVAWSSRARVIAAPYILDEELAGERPGQVHRQVDVFTSGNDGYHTYRIPAVVRTNQETLLAFCEGRKTSQDDHGDVDLMLRTSADGGKTWQPMRLVYEEGGTAKITTGNPCPVVDRHTGTVWLPFCRNNDRVFVTKSIDDGKTWVRPIEITKHVKGPEWGWFATGPGHGIRLDTGRLVIPCDFYDDKGWREWAKHERSMIFYSDDHGRSWQMGGVTEPGMGETAVVELADGSLLISMRQCLVRSQRAFARSGDGGLTWSKPEHNPQVYSPNCQASIQRYTLQPQAAKNRLLHSGPGGPGRVNMTIRLSYDEGKTWPVAKVLHDGSAAYSDLVVLPDGTIGCLYERDDYGKITFARFSLDWLTDGQDRLAKKQ